MANRDQGWGHRGRHGQHDRWRRDEEHRRMEHDRPWEDRSFGQAGDERGDMRYGGEGRRWEGGEPWRGEARYGARYDQDRAGGGYGGQEYGVEGGRGHAMDAGRRPSRDQDERETWRPDRGEPYGDLELNPRNRGVQEFGPPADYAYHPQAGHEFDPDYLHWREEQMRGHDRDYHEWRRNQREAYDEDYRRFRTERREHFGRSFQDWRAQRSAAGGVPDTGVAPGMTGGYGSKVGMPTGYDANASSKPSGMLEPPEAMNASAGAGQTGGATRSGTTGARGGRRTQAKARDAGSEFGKEPPQVQAASDAGGGRAGEEKRRDERR